MRRCPLGSDAAGGSDADAGWFAPGAGCFDAGSIGRGSGIDTGADCDVDSGIADSGNAGSVARDSGACSSGAGVGSDCFGADFGIDSGRDIGLGSGTGSDLDVGAAGAALISIETRSAFRAQDHAHS